MPTESTCAKAYGWSNLWVECHPGTAAWVAAIGVIATFIVAIIIALVQRQQAIKDQLTGADVARMKLLADTAVLVFQIKNFLTGFPAWVAAGQENKIPEFDTRPDKAMVLSWLLYESEFPKIDDPGIVQVLADLRARLHKISRLLNELSDGEIGLVKQTRRGQAAEVAKVALEDCASFDRCYSDYRNRGGPPDYE